MEREKRIERAYAIAREEYAELGVDSEQAMRRLDATAISLHCWQTDDVGGVNGPAPFCRAAGSRPPAITRARREIFRRYGRTLKRSMH